MSYPTQPPAWQPPPPRQVSGRRKLKIAGIGCGGLVAAVLVIGGIAAAVDPPKKTAATGPAAAVQTTPVASAAPTSAAPTTAAPTTAAPTTAKPPVPAPTTAKPKKPAAIHLARGAQHGLTNCIISYKNAQDGDGTSTFTALVVNKSGAPYAPTGSNPYSILLQMNLTDTSGTASRKRGPRERVQDRCGQPWRKRLVHRRPGRRPSQREQHPGPRGRDVERASGSGEERRGKHHDHERD